MMKKFMGIAFASVTGAMLFAMPAHALSAKECSVLFQTAKDKNTLNGMKWQDFRKANCGADAAAAEPVVEKPAKEKKVEAPAGPAAEIEFGDFTKVSLKAGKVLAAEKVEKADKLLKLSVDLGEGAPRTIVSGIAEAFLPEQLIGKNVVVVVNLKPRALKGIESRGMILAAGSGKSLQLINPGDVAAGSDVK